MSEAEFYNARKVRLTGTERREIIAKAAPRALRVIEREDFSIPEDELVALLDEAFLLGKISGMRTML